MIEAGVDMDKAGLLIEAGVDINKAKHCGQTPLFIAAMQGHLEALTLLIEARADCNRAWQVAAEMGHVDILQVLKEAGGDQNEVGNGRNFPVLCFNALRAAIVDA